MCSLTSLKWQICPSVHSNCCITWRDKKYCKNKIRAHEFVIVIQQRICELGVTWNCDCVCVKISLHFHEYFCIFHWASRSFCLFFVSLDIKWSDENTQSFVFVFPGSFRQELTHRFTHICWLGPVLTWRSAAPVWCCSPRSTSSWLSACPRCAASLRMPSPSSLLPGACVTQTAGSQVPIR